MDTIQQSLEQMMEHFNTRMAAFQDNLEKASGAPVTLVSLAADFSNFKSLIGDSLINLQHQVQVLAQQQDHLEMHSRRKILLIHGIREDCDANLTLQVTKLFAEKLKVSISLDNISRIHHMGRVTGGKPRPILVKFRSIEVRNKVWTAKTGFKSSGITMSEFLTKVRHEAFMNARKHFGISKCWTQNGAVLIIGTDGKKHQVSSGADLNRLINLSQSVVCDNTTLPTTSQLVTAQKTSDMAAVTRSKRILKK
ncbi:uncharacterized protein LOC131845780 [Achroia grisella]|uniref:uncharacterized protein LOC131845780 n=1 Tax=Achroia grisella TaxID=688607 RepID=UPI0027D30D6B|nr:uncharacterized protein LOC131845780 [Achroia grisella]